MSYSLNEVGALARKAARGAGYPWSIADEAGTATVWLCQNGAQAVPALARLLSSGFGEALASHVPRGLNSPWAADAVLCPLVTGAALSDCADRLAQDAIVMSRVAEPLLVIPFAANAARALDCCVRLDMDGLTVVTDGTQMSSTDNLPEFARQVTATLTDAMPDAQIKQPRVTPCPTSWAALNTFAHRTYAPATEASRASGAGAGLTDND